MAKVVGTACAAIVAETRRLLLDSGHYARKARGGSPYGNGRAAERIRDIIWQFLHGAAA